MCYVCNYYLRKPKQCTKCNIVCCEACIEVSQAVLGFTSQTCPNKACEEIDEFEEISPVARKLLSNLKIDCEECR